VAGKIKEIAPGSLAEELGLEPMDELVAINGHQLRDILDYYYYSNVSDLVLTVRKQEETWVIETEKDPDEPLGITFTDVLFDRVKTCANRCLFCFEDQMPAGMRASLREKDDDYRLSFLYGNFITLTNLKKSDWERIATQRLSPLYVSVHATDPKVRARLLRNPKAALIREHLTWLREHNIQVHCQIVLCPGENDGEILDRTIEDLRRFWPTVLSVAVVPVGLTRFRTHLSPLRSVRPPEARQLIAACAKVQDRCLEEFGTRFLWLSDEFYYLAQAPVPRGDFYEEFAQLENGVGMVAAFREELAQCTWPRRLGREKSVTIATGKMGAYFLQDFFVLLSGIGNLRCNVVVVENRFFGSLVTATGLITGEDLVAALREQELGDYLVLPRVMVNQDLFFLDDWHLDDVAKRLNVPIRLVDGAAEMAGFIEELAAE